MNSTEQNIETHESASKPKPSRKRAYGRTVLGFALALLVTGFLVYRHYKSVESTDDAFIDAQFSIISPRVPGFVVKVHVDDNQWVKAGDLLVELDPGDYTARLETALANLEAAKAADRARNLDVKVITITTQAGLNEAKANLDSSNAAVESANAQRALSLSAMDQAMAEADSAQARYDRDAMDLKRYQEMAVNQVVSQQALEHKTAGERMAAADLMAASKNIDTRRSMIHQAEAALKAAKSNQRQAAARLSSAQSAPEKVEQSLSHAAMAAADVRKAGAEVEQARLNMSYTRIIAPMDGYITRKNVAQGVLVQAGQSLLALVPKEIWVTANFKETQISKMRSGQMVDIRVDSYPDIRFKGKVESLQRGTGSLFSLLPPENATGNFVKVVQRIPVKITLIQDEISSDIILTPGMSVTAHVSVLLHENETAPPKVAGSAEPLEKDGGA